MKSFTAFLLATVGSTGTSAFVWGFRDKWSDGSCIERNEICPDVKYCQKALFKSECFQVNQERFSRKCLDRYAEFTDEIGMHVAQQCENVKEICPENEIEPLAFIDFFKTDCFIQNFEKFNLKCQYIANWWNHGQKMTKKSSCMVEAEKFCNKSQDHKGFGAIYIFNRPCFSENLENLSSECKVEYNEYLESRTQNYIEDGEDHLYEACHEDRVALCPDITPPFSPARLFTSECFRQNKDKLTKKCKKLIKKFEKHEMKNKIPVITPDSKDVIVFVWNIKVSKPHHKKKHQFVSKQSYGNELYSSCHADRVQFCPYIPGPYCPKKLFESPCFQENLPKMSDKCQQFAQRYHDRTSKRNHSHFGWAFGCAWFKHIKNAFKNFYHHFPKTSIAATVIIGSLIALNSLIVLYTVISRRYQLNQRELLPTEDTDDDDALLGENQVKLTFLPFSVGKGKPKYSPLPTDNELPSYPPTNVVKSPEV